MAEWSWALLLRKKINNNQKDPGFAPQPKQSLKQHWSLKEELDSVMGKLKLFFINRLGDHNWTGHVRIIKSKRQEC